MKIKLKKSIVYTLTACIAVGLFSSVLSGAMKAKAKDDNTPNVTAYATAEQLKDNANFALSASYKGTAKKVAFGQDGSGNTQYWYIAGADPDTQTNGGLVLLAETPLAKEKFQTIASTIYNEKIEGTYESAKTQAVFPNHYGSSNVRDILQSLENDSKYFSAAEQDLMQETTIFTYDRKNHSTYSTTDKLYLAHGVVNDNYITVGSNSSQDLGKGLKIDTDKPYINNDLSFWLRSTRSNGQKDACMAQTGSVVSGQWDVIIKHDVLPAFSLDLSSVLFASAVPASATDSGTIKTEDAFVMRADGSTKLTGSTASYTAGEVTVKPAANATVTCVVQGNDKTNDWYYASSVNGEKTISAQTIQSALGLAVEPDMNDCEIWIETTQDCITYAVKAAKDTQTTEKEIKNVEITGIDAPVAGTALDTSAISNTVGIQSVSAVTWTPNDKTADYNTQYTASVTLTPSAGYIVASSSTASVNGNAATSVKLNADKTLTVTYQFAATAGKEPVSTTYNIKVENDGNGTASADINNAAAGTTVTLTAAPNEGYKFKEWQVVSGGVVVNNNSFVMPSNDVVVKAVFEEETTEGKVDVDVVVGEKAPAMTISNTKEELVDKISWTADEQQLITAGNDIKISMEITDLNSTVNEDDKKIVTDVLGDKTVGQYVDISVFKQVGSLEKTPVKETNGKIKITVTLPETLKADASKTRIYQMVCVHDGKATVLDADYNTANGTLTFESDMFSTYAIVYKDVTEEEPSQEQPTEKPTVEEPTQNPTQQSTTKDNNAVTDDRPGTGDDKPIMWLFALVLISGIVVIAVGLKLKRKVCREMMKNI